MTELPMCVTPTESGSYAVEVCEYPQANPKARMYHVWRYDVALGWMERLHPSRRDSVVYFAHGPLDTSKLETLDEPDAPTFAVVYIQSYPNGTPKLREWRICVWRQNKWYDAYGFAPQYGNVWGWAPLPPLDEKKKWQREEAKNV